MKMPWNDKTGLAKAAAFFATLFLVSLGLCGANFGALMLSAALGKVWINVGNGMSAVFIVTAYVESLGMIVGIVGLLLVALAMVGRLVLNASRRG